MKRVALLILVAFGGKRKELSKPIGSGRSLVSWVYVVKASVQELEVRT